MFKISPGKCQLRNLQQPLENVPVRLCLSRQPVFFCVACSELPASPVRPLCSAVWSYDTAVVLKMSKPLNEHH